MFIRFVNSSIFDFHYIMLTMINDQLPEILGRNTLGKKASTLAYVISDWMGLWKSNDFKNDKIRNA